MRRLWLLAFLILAVSALPAAAADTVLEFETMEGVDGPFLAQANNPIRGVPGGGRTWVLTRAKGELTDDGKLEIVVKGLVIPGVGNPVAAFRGLVSCLTVSGGAVVTDNVSTADFPATPAGDAVIEAMVDLPDPCIAPIVFVTSPGGSWFAATGF